MQVHQISDNDSLNRTHPKLVREQHANIEPVNVVGQQVDDLSAGRLSQGRLAEPQRLAVDQRAAGDAHLHADVQDAHHVRVGHADVDEGAEDHARRVIVGFFFGDGVLVGRVELD